ncbi:MAG: hypothetical protein AMJ78_00815 [Omnitrophica WOR_2 bacterium SM23_29]|nr:MAG: hypothetical protein AMJ78_00815 [Omnitrophica WOR_2 bacterium SM23_29]
MDDITKGKLEVYCECVAKGCKPVALLEALVPKISSFNKKRIKVGNPAQRDVKDFLKEAKPIIDEWGLKFYVEYFAGKIKCDGQSYKTRNYDLWIYKNNRELSRIKKVIKLSESQDEKKYHRQFGRLLGYSEEAIEEFIKTVNLKGESK